MIDARDRILSRIRAATGAATRADEEWKSLRDRISTPRRGPIPAGALQPAAELANLFEARAMRHANTVTRVTSTSDAVTAVEDFLQTHNLPRNIVAAPSESLDMLLQGISDAVSIRRGAAVESDVTSLVPVVCAVAETGTMVTISGPQTPSTLNFVPENQIVLVRETDIVPCYEDGWDKVRALGVIPRTVNWLSGPSRSADIGQVMYLGAHGPRRQHVVLLEDSV